MKIAGPLSECRQSLGFVWMPIRLLLIGLLASPLILVGCSRSHSSDSEKDTAEGEEGTKGIPVELAFAEVKPLSSFFETTTTLEAEKEAQILAKVPSQVTQILAEEGDFVNEGEILAILDDRELVLQLEEANLQMETWKSEVERLESIHSKHLISEKELDDARHQFQVYQTQAKRAELKLSYTRVESPFAGTVTLRHVDVGDNVTVGAPLYGVADLNPVRAKMYLPEKVSSTVQVGQKVVLVPDAADDLTLDGRVAMKAPIVDTRTGTVKVTVELVQPLPARVPLGAFVRGRITTDTRHQATVIPKRAVISDLGENFIFVAEADSVRKIKVTLGYEGDSLVEIVEGIDEGSRVVVVGQGSLRNGSKIREITEQDVESPEAEDSLDQNEVEEEA